MPTRRPTAPQARRDEPLLSAGKLDELFDRLTSRKLWMALLTIGFAAWNYYDGRLTPEQFQTAITAAALGYMGAEGLTDFAAGWGQRREEARAETEQATARALEAHAELRRMGVSTPSQSTRSMANSVSATLDNASSFIGRTP